MARFQVVVEAYLASRELDQASLSRLAFCHGARLQAWRESFFCGPCGEHDRGLLLRRFPKRYESKQQGLRSR